MYQFLGESTEFTNDDLRILLDVNGMMPEEIDRVVEFLLYYGFLDIRDAEEDPQYIYDVDCNMEILKTRISKNLKAITYTFNPEFWPALYIQQQTIAISQGTCCLGISICSCFLCNRCGLRRA